MANLFKCHVSEGGQPNFHACPKVEAFNRPIIVPCICENAAEQYEANSHEAKEERSVQQRQVCSSIDADYFWSCRTSHSIPESVPTPLRFVQGLTKQRSKILTHGLRKEPDNERIDCQCCEHEHEDGAQRASLLGSGRIGNRGLRLQHIVLLYRQRADGGHTASLSIDDLSRGMGSLNGTEFSPRPADMSSRMLDACGLEPEITEVDVGNEGNNLYAVSGCREFFVFQILRMNQPQHRVPKQVRVLPIIKSPRHLIEVSGQMLRGYAMPRSNDAALQKRERGFDGVRMDVGSDADVFLLSVIDGLMLAAWHSSFIQRERVCEEFVRHDHVYIAAHVLADVLRQCSTLGILSVKESQFSGSLTLIALANSDYNLFLLFASINTPADLLAAYIGLVYLYSAIQFSSGLLDSMANTMRQIPRCTVIDSEHSLELIRADALAGLAHDEYGKEPFGQGKMCIVKDRASGDGELICA